MPELTELKNSLAEVEGLGVEVKDGSGSDSDSEDSHGDHEQCGTGGAMSGAGASGVGESSSKAAKQSRSEKKARKIMSKLGLKQVPGVVVLPFVKVKIFYSLLINQMSTRIQHQTHISSSVKLRLKT